MQKLIIIILMFALISCSLNKQNKKIEVAQDDLYKVEKVAAIEAAEDWLTLFDAEEYDKCYLISSSLLKQSVAQNDLVKLLTETKEKIGKTSKRTLLKAEHYNILPGVPKGEYVVIQYTSRSESSKMILETITPMLDNGVWRVSGYYIQ